MKRSTNLQPTLPLIYIVDDLSPRDSTPEGYFLQHGTAGLDGSTVIK